MSKVDQILQEIYLEMEMEEVNELFEQYVDKQLVLQEIDVAKLKSDILRFLGLKRTLMDRAKALVGQGNTSAAEKVKNQLATLNDKISDAKKALSGAVSTAAQKGGEAIEKGREMAGGVGKKISGAVGQAKQLAADNPEAAAYAAMAGFVAANIAAGVVIYKKFFSQAAKACRGKKGPDKKNCVKSFKIKGLMAAKAKISSGIAKCKDPKCKAKLQAKVQSFDAKISAMKGAVSESVINKYVGDFMSEVFERNSKN
jgi:hypothetical protein